MRSQRTHSQSATAARSVSIKRAPYSAGAWPHAIAADASFTVAKRPLPDTMVHCQTIGGKAVYIFESQRSAFAIWNQIRLAVGIAPRLLTFGFQASAQPAFEHHAWFNPFPLGWGQTDSEKRRRRAQRQLTAVDINDNASVAAATAKLRHTERLDAAQRCGIIELAFVIAMQRNMPLQSNEQLALDRENRRLIAQSLSEETGDSTECTREAIDLPSVADPPYTYSIPDSGIIEVPWHCDASGFLSQRKMARAALEAPVLRRILATIDDICRTGGVSGLFERSYILDINLDFFSTHRAVSPQDTSLFYELIRRSAGITIALESDFVYPEQAEMRGANGAKLLAKLERHIVKALA